MGVIKDLKHFIKILIGRKDPFWGFEKFEENMNKDTWKQHDAIVSWADECLKNKNHFENESTIKQQFNTKVTSGFELINKVKNEFKDKYKDIKNIKILIHLPPMEVSPGGHSLFSNLIQTLNFIGVPSRGLSWTENTECILNDFQPTILLTGDDKNYLTKINWQAIKTYKQQNTLKIGLSASLEEYGNTPLPERLNWAKENKIDFYYTFRTLEYIQERQKDYSPFFEKGYQILSVPFGANILTYYPISNINRDLNYVFLASRNKPKWPRYFEYLGPITKKYSGFIDGPGWSKIQRYSFDQNRDRYYYSRAKIGLNLHLDEQIKWAGEINERTYMLAACGTPQLIDNPKLIDQYFTKDCFFLANNSKEYLELFEYMIKNPQECEKRALQSQAEVCNKHTTFHRAENFIKQLKISII